MFPLILIVVVVIAYLVIRSNQKRKASAWTGVVSDKVVREDSDGGGAYYVTFKTDAGDKIKLTVKKSLFEALSVGDKVEKRSGERNPVKV